MKSASDNRALVQSYVRRQLLGFRANIAASIVNVVLRSLLFLLPPFMTKYILEQLLPQHNWNLLLVVSFCILIVPIVGSAMIVAESFTNRTMLRVSAQGRADLYNGLQRQPFDWLQKRTSGDLITRVLDDTGKITDLATGSFFWMLFLAVSIAAGFAILLYLHAGLGTILIVLWLINGVVMAALGRRITSNAAEMSRQTSLVTEAFREIVSAASFIKASGLEPRSHAAVSACLQREWAHTRRGIAAEHAVQFINVFMNSLFLAVVYFAGGTWVAEGEMTVGSWVACVAVYQWIRPFGITLFDTLAQSGKVIPAIGRVAEIARPVVPADGLRPPDKLLSVTVDRLMFGYDGKPVLTDVGFHLPSGTLTAIVGFSGVGKSTLVDLLLGLRQPDGGTVSINGISLPDLDPRWLRSRMLCVTQDVPLRMGTIRDNIVYGCEEVEEERLLEAVRTAELEPWLSALDEGIHTSVGEQGLAISGGEKQRIGIARALLRKPSILILDEATSALDADTERRFLQTLTERLNDTTILFITHRLAVAKHAHQVLFMHNGSIVESGPYDRLMALQGMFWALQAGASQTSRIGS